MTSPAPVLPHPKPPLPLRIERSLRRAMFLAGRTLVRSVRFERVRALGALLGELQFQLGFVPRRRMVRDLAALQGRGADDPAVKREMREAYRINDAAVLEVLKMFDRRQDPAMLLAHVEVDGIALLRQALEGGRGAILLATHAGNSALLVVRLAAAGVPVSMVFRESRMMDAGLFERGLSAYGVEGILATDGLKAYGRMLGALRSNRVVFIMADQGVKKARDGMVFRFLGKDMPMPGGPAQLARHAEAPVLPVATVAVEPVWRFEIRSAIPRQADASLEADVESLLRASEQMIMSNPQWWSWHHRRWRRFPLAADPARGVEGHH